MEKGADEAGNVDIGGALAVTIGLSVFFGAICALLGLVGAVNRGDRDFVIFMLAMGAIHLGGALLAWRGGTVWPLRLGWIGLFAGFFVADVPVGLMEGAIITIPIFFVLCTGLIAAVFSKRRRRTTRKS